jgi:hypothetical protein
MTGSRPLGSYFSLRCPRKIHKKTERRGSYKKKHGKKQNLQFDASSKFGGTTSTSPHGSRTYGSRRTITNFLDIGGRDEVDAKVIWFLYACGIPFNVLLSPY